MSKKYLGIDIGGTAVKLGILNEDGFLFTSNQYSVSFDHYKTPILNTVLTSTDLFLSENHLLPKDLTGIGISATGQIDYKLGMVAGSGGNIKNWEGTDLKSAFYKKYHLSTTVTNDANCVALGEKWIGSAKNAHHAIILTIGTGLGGGIIVNNNILLGQSGYGGEIGHFSIHKHGRQCTCGNHGCFEQYASMTALIKQIRTYYQTVNPDYLLSHPLNGKTIFEMVSSGNKIITEMVDSWIADIAYGIVSLIHIFNPEQIVIGGGVCIQEELFISKLRYQVMKNVMPNFRKNLTLNAATLGNNAGLIGAVYYFMTTQGKNDI